MSCKVGSFQVTTAVATTEIAVTGLGFRPDAVFFRWTGINSAVDVGPALATLQAGEGFMLANGKSGCIAMYQQHGADPYGAGSGIFNDAAIVRAFNQSTVGGKASYCSMDSDGFTVIIDSQFSAEQTILYIAIEGVEFNAIEVTEPGSTGVQAYTGAGFEPTFVKTFSAGKTAFGTISSNVQVGTGAASDTGADSQFTTANYEANGLGYADTASYGRRTECLSLCIGGSIITRAKLNGFTSDGLELDWLERSASYKHLVVVANGRWYVNNDTTQTDGNPWTSTGMTWAPLAAMVYSHCQAESTQDVRDTDSKISIGYGISASSRGAMNNSGTADGGAGASQIKYAHEFDEIYIKIQLGGTTTYQGLMDINADFSADTIQWVMDDVDTANSFFGYIAIGPPITDYRESLVRYSHNTYQSRKAGRLLIRDLTLGRDLPPEQVETDNWVFSGAFGFPTPVKYDNLLEDPNVFYSETVGLSGGKLRIGTDRESFLESLIRKMGRG